MQTGIIGLSNVGKTILFNAITGLANSTPGCPFCTIDANVDIVPVKSSLVRDSKDTFVGGV